MSTFPGMSCTSDLYCQSDLDCRLLGQWAMLSSVSVLRKVQRQHLSNRCVDDCKSLLYPRFRPDSIVVGVFSVRLQDFADPLDPFK